MIPGMSATRVALEVSSWLAIVSAGIAFIIIIADSIWGWSKERRERSRLREGRDSKRVDP